MKSLRVIIFSVIFFGLAVMFTSCSDDGYSLGDMWVGIATVEDIDGTNFTLTVGDSTTLWIGASNVPHYQPKQKRALINFTILGDNYAGYDHIVKLNSIKEILTKDVKPIERDSLNKLPNDPIRLKSMWISGGYLNIRFSYPYGGDSQHEVNLFEAKETGGVSSGNAIKLEFRHDKNGDSDRWWTETYASFDLQSLQVVGQDSVELEIKTNTNSGENISMITYRY